MSEFPKWKNQRTFFKATIVGAVALSLIMTTMVVSGQSIISIAAQAQQQGRTPSDQTVSAQSISIPPLTPQKVILFSDSTEPSTNTVMTVASATYNFTKFHRLLVDFSSVGAISNSTNQRALLYLGCFIDGSPCFGKNTDPDNTPGGYVNPLSCDYSTCAAWDNNVSHVWFTKSLAPGTHTVVIKVAVGNSLFGFGGPGTAFDEARNLAVTILAP